jgi:hypothetical protein
MNKFALGFLALTAISTAALAERTDIDPRDRMPVAGTSVVESEGAMMPAGGSLSAFERVQLQSAENENGGN